LATDDNLAATQVCTAKARASVVTEAASSLLMKMLQRDVEVTRHIVRHDPVVDLLLDPVRRRFTTPAISNRIRR
jgi:hypothetical protein